MRLKVELMTQMDETEFVSRRWQLKQLKTHIQLYLDDCSV